MARINWTRVYQYYLSGESVSYRDVANKFGISYDYVKEIGAKENWIAKKLQVQQYAHKLIENQSAATLAKRNEEHIKQARLLQGTALEAIAEKGLRPETYDVARKALEVGQKLERIALNMDRRDTHSVEITNNNGKLLRISWGNGEAIGDFTQTDGHLEAVKTYDTY